MKQRTELARSLHSDVLKLVKELISPTKTTDVGCTLIVIESKLGRLADELMELEAEFAKEADVLNSQIVAEIKKRLEHESAMKWFAEEHDKAKGIPSRPAEQAVKEMLDFRDRPKRPSRKFRVIHGLKDAPKKKK